MNLRLSSVFVAVAAASLLMVSTTGIAAHKHHKAAPQENYKAENFKAEVPPPCPPVLMLRDGFYVGIGVGYDSYRVHSTSDVTVSDLAGIVAYSQTASSNDSATGWMGGIFAGYGRYFDWFYLAAEINANASDADTTRNFSNSFGDSDTVKGKARSSYGIGLLPGIKLNDSSLLYVRLAYLRTNFKTSESGTNVDIFDGSSTTSYSESSSEWRNGFQYGVGIETAVAEDVSLRGEYTHTSYNSKTVSASVADADDDIIVSASDKFNVSNNEFMLSLIYHFCL